MFQSLFKKHSQKELFYDYIDHVMKKNLPSQIVAIGLNLYEDGNDHWSMEIIGTSYFDVDNSDWVCEEIFSTRDNPYTWVQKETWENILANMIDMLEEYLVNGKYAEKLKKYQGIGIGFVEGDLYVIEGMRK